MRTVLLQADRESDGEDECRCFEKQFRYRAHRSGEFLFSLFLQYRCLIRMNPDPVGERVRDPDSGNVLEFFK